MKFQRTVMGRKVIHHSPDKHPEQDDPRVQTDNDLTAAMDARAASRAQRGVPQDATSSNDDSYLKQKYRQGMGPIYGVGRSGMPSNTP